MVEVALKCSCREVEGFAHDISPSTATRIICHCDDCQAFAKYLNREADVLDRRGGTEVLQVTPAQIKITRGADKIRCVRLGPKGLYRWYTNCCNTPIANSPSPDLPLTSLIHSFMDDNIQREKKLGPVRYSIMGKFAKKITNNTADINIATKSGNNPAEKGPKVQKIHPGFPLGIYLHILPKLILNKIRGRHKPSPFFDSKGAPVSEPLQYSALALKE